MSSLFRWRSFRSSLSPERVNAEVAPQSHSSIDDLGPPASIVNLFNDAAGYKQALAEGTEERLFPPVQPANPALKSVQDFAELAGDDLDPPEHDVVGRFAQLAVEDWELHDGDSLYTEEPGDMSEDEHAEDLQQPETVQTKPVVTPLQTDIEDEDRLPLTPERVLSLLVEEFGPLAPSGEEKLLLEADGAVIQDVVILGAIHLTTHRITFHASMPPSDPSNEARDIIKVGPAWVHRKGLHRKRRIWLELSHDFVSAFPSAREEDRIRPIRSIMLPSILEILPEDPKQPRMILSVLDGKSGITNGHLEMDTIESAREWRREIKAAMFFARRRRRQILSRVDSEDVDGVRINIPLHRVLAHNYRLHSDAIPVLTLTVDSTPSSEADATHEVIELATFKFNEECLSRLKTLIHDARKRSIFPDGSFIDQPVVVDFGIPDESPVEPKEKDRSDPVEQRSKDQIVCDTLGIEYKPDVWVARAALSIGLACVGYIVICSECVGFLSKSLALRDVRYRLTAVTIRTATKVEFPMLVYGLQLEIEGHSNLRFRFRSEALRDEAIHRVNELIAKNSRRSSLSLTPPHSSSSSATIESDGETSTRRTPVRSQTSILSPLTRKYSGTRRQITPSKLLEFPKAINLVHMELRRISPRHFVCLTIGSRGDVQPYIALGLGLKKKGHRVTIVTHEEYKGWIEGFGLQHRQAGGDPGGLMKLSVENKMFSPHFFKTSLSNYRSWLDDLLHDAWESCSDADVLLESPYAMAGVHIAEALHIPYFRACTMPWTKTTEFPHPFISGPVETPTFNSLTYVLFDNIFWTATAGQINRWRKEQLHLEQTVMSHTAQSKIPILYNFSLAVVPKPLDWSDSKIICGYWFLDNPDPDWKAPATLLAFMKQARADEKPLVYIGFGSITVPDPQTMTRHIYEAVQKSDVRAIVSKGWSSRMQKQQGQEIKVPKECYVVDKIPHDWLFPQIDAAMHHGGAGTTGASLRAGIPTLIKPWFGDQYFWASRVQQLGAGLRVSSLRVNDLAAALKKATSDRIMREKANIVGQKVRAEDGVQTAIHNIYTYFPRAYSEGLSPE